MTVIVMLRGAPPEMCTVILNEDPNFVFQFAPLEGTWTVTFPAALGEHSVRVNVGTRQKVVKFLVWREGENVPPEAGRIE